MKNSDPETTFPSRQEIFSQVYESDVWTLADDEAADGASVSRSGLGSNLTQTETLRSELPSLVSKLGIRSFLDIPCGDFFWMSRIDLDVDIYIGADIVPGLVEANGRRYEANDRKFLVLDIVDDMLPRVDLVFSRDCLVHLNNSEVKRALENVKRSGSKYFAATTFTERDDNFDIQTGSWRPLNLSKQPFLLPEPVHIINEKCTEVYTVTQNGSKFEMGFADKSIGVWLVADL